LPLVTFSANSSYMSASRSPTLITRVSGRPDWSSPLAR